MVAELLAVGTELLMGQISNTNAQYLSQKMADLGINVYYHTVVGDNPGRLKDALERALERSDIVITTGGLGPTKDDLTKETIAAAMNRKLEMNQEVYDKIYTFFKKLNREMTENNAKQALLPERSSIIPNPNGTAPGCMIEEAGKMVAMLPGPPKEMQPMFEETVFPYLAMKTGGMFVSKMLKIFGIGESSMESKIIDLIENQENPTIAPYVGQGEITVRVTARAKSIGEGEEIIKPVVDEIKNRMGDMLYDTEGRSMEELAVTLLKEKDMTLSAAESCTGGLLSSKITEIPGASAVFAGGAVTYSNEAKIIQLGVNEETLKNFGAASEETAEEMAEGIRSRLKTSMGVSITGIAGPDGGTDEKPVGTVCIAVSGEDGTVSKKVHLSGNRERVRYTACLTALNMVIAYIAD